MKNCFALSKQRLRDNGEIGKRLTSAKRQYSHAYNLQYNYFIKGNRKEMESMTI